MSGGEGGSPWCSVAVAASLSPFDFKPSFTIDISRHRRGTSGGGYCPPWLVEYSEEETLAVSGCGNVPVEGQLLVLICSSSSSSCMALPRVSLEPRSESGRNATRCPDRRQALEALARSRLCELDASTT